MVGKLITLAAACYLLGAIPFGYIAARMRGIDITKYGSGATGATNVLRTLGWGPALTVAALDISKGVAAVLLARQVFGPSGYSAAVLAGIAAMAGHSFSPYLRFKGGKSVSVGAGVIVSLMPVVIVYALAAFLTVVAVTRYVSLGSLVATGTAVCAAVFTRQPSPYLALMAGAALLVLYQHRSNLRRLVTGTEAKLGEKVKIR